MKFIRLSIIASTAFLTACNFAPKYETPDISLPDTFNNNSTNQVSVANLKWESFFVDQTLKKLVQLALENNHDLKQASLNVLAAQSQYGISVSELIPKVGASFRQNVSEVPRAGIQRTYIVGLGINNFEIDFWGKIRNQNESALQKYFATESAQKAAQINLIAAVANTYFAYAVLSENEKIIRDILNSYNTTYNLIKQKFSVGLASQLELNQAQSSVLTAQSKLEETLKNKALTYNALQLMTGISFKDVLNLNNQTNVFNKKIVQDLPPGLPSSLLTRRPDIIASEHNLKSTYADIGAARAAFFPSISLTGLFGLVSGDLNKLFTPNHETWNFTPTVTLPIFAAGALKNAKDLATVRKEIAVVNYEKTVYTAFKEVNDALITIESSENQLKNSSEQAKLMGQNSKLAFMRYEAGIDNFLQVQQAQLGVLNSKQAYLNSLLQSLQAKVNLYKALGGGWEQSTK